MGTTIGVKVFYSVKLLTLILLFYLPNVLAGDEPAPVVYIDPVTGELRVENPPKLSRDHGTTSPSTGNRAQATEQNQTTKQELQNNDKSLQIGGMITVSIFLVATLFYMLRKRKTS